MTTRAALYARISQDKTGAEAGVQRQLELARAHAARNGWEVVAEFSDNDISATKGKHRPGYTSLMAGAEAGRFDQIIVFHMSRLWRSRVERAAGIERLAKARVGISPTEGQPLDLASSYGRTMAALVGEFDTLESDAKSERVAAAARQRAENGDPNGAVPFGWTRVVETNERGQRIGARDVLNPEEAPIVKEVCARLLSGESLQGVTTWLNESGAPAPGATFNLKGRGRGLQNPTGERWGKTSVRKIALRAQNCGMRQYHKGKPDEELLPMKAEPIITRDEWDRLRAILLAPERQTTRSGARRHLLSYSTVGRCGVCGGPLRASNGKRGGKVYPMYICMAPSGCVGRSREKVDELVRAVVVGRLAQPDARDLLVRDDARAQEALSRAAGLEARLATAADEFAEGNINVTQLRRITERLRPQIDAAHVEARASKPDVPLALLGEVAGPEAGERWDALTVVQRQALVEALFERVALLPRTKRGPGFEPETVEVVWRDASETEEVA